MTNAEERVKQYYIANNYKRNNEEETFLDVAIKFNLEPDKTDRQRYDRAFRILRTLKKNRDKNHNQVTIEKELPSAPEGFQIKSVYQTMGGDWRYSLIPENNGEEEEDIVDTFREIVSEYDFSKVEFPMAINHENGSLIVYLSDIHIGMAKGTDYEEELGDRLDKVVAHVTMLLSLNDFISNVYILDMGDSVDNFEGYTTRGLKKAWTPRAKSMRSSDTFRLFMDKYTSFQIKMLYACLEFSKNIKFIALTNDNHGGEFGEICHEASKAIIQEIVNSVDYEIVTDNFHDEYISGHLFTFTHGFDRSQMRKPLPPKLNEYANRMIIAHFEQYSGKEFMMKHLVKGDTHISHTEYGVSFRYKGVRAFSNPSDWAIKNFGKSLQNCPGVEFDVVYPDQRMITSQTMFF